MRKSNLAFMVSMVVMLLFFKKQSFGNYKAFAKSDTLVGSKIITNEIPGSAYRKSAKQYFVIIGNDTSDFKCIFTEAKGSQKVSMDIDDRRISANKHKPYKRIMNELKAILSVAVKDFNLDSLTEVFAGRLIDFGDLAITITMQYKKTFGLKNNHIDYKKIPGFLLKSNLASDLDTLLKPYYISVKKIHPEHIFFTTKDEVYHRSKIETDRLQVPDKIFDCLVWIELKNDH